MPRLNNDIMVRNIYYTQLIDYFLALKNEHAQLADTLKKQRYAASNIYSLAEMAQNIYNLSAILANASKQTTTQPAK